MWPNFDEHLRFCGNVDCVMCGLCLCMASLQTWNHALQSLYSHILAVGDLHCLLSQCESRQLDQPNSRTKPQHWSCAMMCRAVPDGARPLPKEGGSCIRGLHSAHRDGCAQQVQGGSHVHYTLHHVVAAHAQWLRPPQHYRRRAPPRPPHSYIQYYVFCFFSRRPEKSEDLWVGSEGDKQPTVHCFPLPCNPHCVFFDTVLSQALVVPFGRVTSHV